jgi:hypothetical protein
MINKTEGVGVFIYGDHPKNSVSVTWTLTFGKTLSNEEPWRAMIGINVRDDTTHQHIDVDILRALKRGTLFALKTEDGLVFPCGIYDLEEFDAVGVGLYSLEIASRDQDIITHLEIRWPSSPS